MLEQVKDLYDCGFAIHLLRPKSKVPIESGWTKGPRKTWAELEKIYRPGMNVGVRLGTASHVGEHYLGVIDCDVKSSDPKHLAEMEKRLQEFCPELRADNPVVFSGRGNGSRHVYVLSKEPIRSRRVAQSSEVVEVRMPSITKASKREIETLSPENVKSGTRLRPAWELSLMGEGSQVVLPPSLHPDSLRAYTWGCLFDTTRAAVINEMSLQKTKQDHGQRVDTQPNSSVEGLKFNFEEVDLIGCQLPDQTVDLIMTGALCEDRSNSLLFTASEMVRCGFTDAQILSVLTDSSTFLGKTAFDHAKTTSRIRAAQWVDRFTLRKARLENDATLQFESEVECVVLSDEAALAQMEELIGEGINWRSKLARNDQGGVKNTLQNVLLILRNEFGPSAFKRNLFSYKRVNGVDFPWAKAMSEVTDDHVVMIIEFISRKYGFEPKGDKVHQVVVVISAENSFHPVRDYLDALTWDGVERLDRVLETYLFCQGSEKYLRAVSRKTFCAMIARIYRPGIKFDHVLILEGLRQGEGKTRFINAIGGAWSGLINLNKNHQDLVLLIRDKWIIELSELAGLAKRKEDMESVKSFLSTESDRTRVPYGKLPEDFPRQCVFIGTTNEFDYLSDASGNRRFWPVRTQGVCDVDSFLRDRDQIFAEAKWVWDNLNEPLWLEDKEIEGIARTNQAERMEDDPWIEEITAWLENSEIIFDRGAFSMGDLFKGHGPLAEHPDHMMNVRRAAKSLRRLGYVSRNIRSGNKVTKRWGRL